MNKEEILLILSTLTEDNLKSLLEVTNIFTEEELKKVVTKIKEGKNVKKLILNYL